jgi:hypothetical protein
MGTIMASAQGQTNQSCMLVEAKDVASLGFAIAAVLQGFEKSGRAAWEQLLDSASAFICDSAGSVALFHL